MHASDRYLNSGTLEDLRREEDVVGYASGLSHGIINQAQYSALVAAVVGSAVVPTLIANAFYLPRHLLAQSDAKPSGATQQQARIGSCDQAG